MICANLAEKLPASTCKTVVSSSSKRAAVEQIKQLCPNQQRLQDKIVSVETTGSDKTLMITLRAQRV